MSSVPLETRRGAWWAIGVLGLLYVLSFVDRFILALLVQPLKNDLEISDVQLGLLFGPAFALFYALLGIPLARLADRGNRRLLIFGGVTLWALATIGSGFSNAYWQLLVLRIGLAIGEAALTPAVYSLIGDLFPPSRRPFAASIYTGLGMMGSAGAYILGAFVIQLVESGALFGELVSFRPWQVVFFVVGCPALLVGIVFVLTVQEPARTGGIQEAPSLLSVFGFLRQNYRLYTGLFVGAGLIQAIGYAYSAWGVEFLRRAHDWPVQQAGLAFGVAALFAGFGGTLAAPALVRFLEGRGVLGAIALASLMGLTAGACLAAVAPLVPNPYVYLVVHAVASFCLIGAANNVLVSLQILAPARMRATMVALLLMCFTLFGLGVGPAAAALLSSLLASDGGSLGQALAMLAPLVGGPAFLLLFWSRKEMMRRAIAERGT